MDQRGFEPRSCEVLIRLSFAIDSNFWPANIITYAYSRYEKDRIIVTFRDNVNLFF